MALCIAAFGWLSLPAHDIITTNLTYTRDISRIFSQRCVACHGAGSSIPLNTYEDARPWAVDIKEQVLSRAMPPWGAVKGFGHLAPDGALSQEEIMIIAAWVIGGAPKGDPNLLPKGGAAVVKPVPSPLQDAVTVTNRQVLSAPLQLTGIRPLPQDPIASARIVATLPDGRIEPLLWLYKYDPKNNRTFRFREQVALPARTVIEASAPVRFVLESPIASSPAQ